VTGVASPAADQQARDRRIYRVAGPLALIGAVLLGIGAVMPWVTYGAPGKAHVQRDGFQLGAAIDSIGIGPVIVGAAGLLLLAGVVTALQFWHPNLVMPLFPVTVAGLVIANSWNQVFSPGGPSSLDAGMAVCLLGIGLGLASSVVLLRAEHPRTR
jgi:hypothetical protein